MIFIQKAETIPDSLKKAQQRLSGKYNDFDVVDQLKADSGDKCYICELKNLSDPEVEHLLPHKKGKYIERKYNWKNLFWVCRHCNSVKNASKYNEMIINCCETDPEEHILQKLEENTVVVESLDSDSITEKTAMLIEECFNLQNCGIRKAGAQVRLRKLQMVMNVFYKAILEYEQSGSEFSERTIKAMMAPKAEFAGFTRAYWKRWNKQSTK